MSDSIPCPKCQAPTWVETDNRVVRPVLRCMCGLHKYVTEEYLAQAREEIRSQQRAAAEMVARLEAQKALQAVPKKPRCCWPECPNWPRANSIYCSRTCSNKNARARHAARQAAQSLAS